MSGIYVHIPFCKSRCIYCGFYSTTLENLQDCYIDSVIKEIDIRKDYLTKEVKTVYIGGGTPSVLSHNNIIRLCGKLRSIAPTVEEFTIECNPDDVTEDYATMLAANGVSRVSMGAQTFSEQRLRFLHRRHKSDDVERAVKALRNAGIKNISIDLMFGFPQETIAEWENDIDKVISLGVEHVSAYSLMYEEGTPLYSLLEKGKIEEVDEEVSRNMYDVLIDKLTAAGYEQYEISNFSRPGFHSRHNSSYWDGTEYLGIGAAAHSYDGKSRQWNIADVKRYTEFLASGNPTEDYIEEREILTETELYNDIITTALRTRKGIDLARIKESDRSFLLASAANDIEIGNLTIEDNHLHLTRKGLYISDAVMVNLISY